MSGVNLATLLPDPACFGVDSEISFLAFQREIGWKRRRTPPLHLAILDGSPGRVAELVEDGFFVDARDKENRTPLMLCCEMPEGDRWAYQCAQVLLEFGANVEVCTPMGFSPLTIADSLERGKMVSLLEDHASPEWIASERSYQLRKVAAHIHGVVVSSFVERPLSKAYFPVMYRVFSKNFVVFFDRRDSMFSSRDGAEIIDVFEKSNCHRSVEEVKADIAVGYPVMMICGWKGHIISLIFFRNFLFIANRGEGIVRDRTVEAFVIDPERLDGSVFDYIRGVENAPLKEGALFFNFCLPRKLSARRNPTREEERLIFAMKLAAAKKIKEDICCWAALKEALRIVATCIKTRDSGVREYIEQAMQVREFCKRFSTSLRQGSLLACEVQAHPDRTFLAAARRKLQKRLKKYPSHQGVPSLFLGLDG